MVQRQKRWFTSFQVVLLWHWCIPQINEILHLKDVVVVQVVLKYLQFSQPGSPPICWRTALILRSDLLFLSSVPTTVLTGDYQTFQKVLLTVSFVIV